MNNEKTLKKMKLINKMNQKGEMGVTWPYIIKIVLALLVLAIFFALVTYNWGTIKDYILGLGPKLRGN